PPGGQIVILQKVLELDYEAVADWPAHKAEIETYVLGHLATLIPDFAARRVVHLSASAQTSYRFTWNTAGAMLGCEMSPEQLGGARPGIEAPIGNLFLTGHWTRPGGGITPVMISALQAAQAVTRASTAAPWQPLPPRAWTTGELEGSA